MVGMIVRCLRFSRTEGAEKLFVGADGSADTGGLHSGQAARGPEVDTKSISDVRTLAQIAGQMSGGSALPGGEC